MRSDSGTYFVGAERELQEALASLNHNHHNGGTWGRIILNGPKGSEFCAPKVNIR